jgi:hypothetical protein
MGLSAAELVFMSDNKRSDMTGSMILRIVHAQKRGLRAIGVP